MLEWKYCYPLFQRFQTRNVKGRNNLRERQTTRSFDVDGTAFDVPEQLEPFSFRIVVHVNFSSRLEHFKRRILYMSVRLMIREGLDHETRPFPSRIGIEQPSILLNHSSDLCREVTPPQEVSS